MAVIIPRSAIVVPKLFLRIPFGLFLVQNAQKISLIFIFFNDVSPASCKGEQALNSELSRSIFGILHSTSIPSLLVVRRGIHWQRGGR